MRTEIKTEDLKFMQTSEGKVGVGYTPEDGGFQVVLWMPEWMADEAAKRLLRKASK